MNRAPSQQADGVQPGARHRAQRAWKSDQDLIDGVYDAGKAQRQKDDKGQEFAVLDEKDREKTLWQLERYVRRQEPPNSKRPPNYATSSKGKRDVWVGTPGRAKTRCDDTMRPRDGQTMVGRLPDGAQRALLAPY